MHKLNIIQRKYLHFKYKSVYQQIDWYNFKL